MKFHRALCVVACTLVGSQGDMGAAGIYQKMKACCSIAKAYAVRVYRDSPYSYENDFDVRTSLLTRATLEDNVPMACALIDLGARVNAVTGREMPHGGYPVLRYAIDSGSVDMFALLLKRGADVDTITSNGPAITSKADWEVRYSFLERLGPLRTCNLTLLSCMILRNTDAAREMLRMSLRQLKERPLGVAHYVNGYADTTGWCRANNPVETGEQLTPTPLMLAAATGNTGAVKILLEHGANLAEKHMRNDGKTALDYAREHGHQGIVELLMQHSKQE